MLIHVDSSLLPSFVDEDVPRFSAQPPDVTAATGCWTLSLGARFIYSKSQVEIEDTVEDSLQTLGEAENTGIEALNAGIKAEAGDEDVQVRDQAEYVQVKEEYDSSAEALRLVDTTGLFVVKTEKDDDDLGSDCRRAQGAKGERAHGAGSFDLGDLNNAEDPDQSEAGMIPDDAASDVHFGDAPNDRDSAASPGVENDMSVNHPDHPDSKEDGDRTGTYCHSDISFELSDDSKDAEASYSELSDDLKNSETYDDDKFVSGYYLNWGSDSSLSDAP